MISDYTVNGKDTRTSIDGGTATGIRKELSQVRDKVNSMIDCLSGTQLSGVELDSAVEESTQKTFEGMKQIIRKNTSLGLTIDELFNAQRYSNGCIHVIIMHS